MNLVIPILANFSDEEKALIERVRKAVAGIHCKFKDPQRPYSPPLRAQAVIWPHPLRLDFQASGGGGMGQSFLGPHIPLTAEVFEGETLNATLLQEFEAGCKDFEEYLANPS
jgi:hypothetical protein